MIVRKLNQAKPSRNKGNFLLDEAQSGGHRVRPTL